MKTYIYADKFFLKSAVHRAGYLEIIDGKFGDIVNEVPEDAEVTDYSGAMDSSRTRRYPYPWVHEPRCHGQRCRRDQSYVRRLIVLWCNFFLADDIDFQQRTSKRCSRNCRTSERFCYRCENPRDLF